MSQKSLMFFDSFLARSMLVLCAVKSIVEFQVAGLRGYFPGHDDATDMGFGLGGLDALVQAAGAEDGFQPGIVDLVDDLGRGVERVGGHDDRPGFQDGKVGQHKLRAIGHADADAFALADAEAAQRGSQAVGLVSDFPVGGGFALEDQADALRAQPGGFIQEVEDRHGGIVEPGGHAGVVMGEPGFGGHAGSIADWGWRVKDRRNQPPFRLPHFEVLKWGETFAFE